MKRICLLLIIAVLSIACSKDRYIDTVIPEQVREFSVAKLPCDYLNIDTVVLMGSGFIDTYDSILFVGFSQREHLFTAISLSNQEHLDLFRAGRGPNEYISPLLLRQQTNALKLSDGLLAFNDINRGKLYWLDIKESMALKNTVIVEEERINYLHDTPIMMNDGNFMTFPNFKGNLALSIDDKENENNIYKEVLNSTSSSFEDNQPLLKLIDKENKRVAFISPFKNYITIYNIATKRFSAYRYIEESNDEICYIDAKSKGDLIVALFSNPCQIHIFTWDGTVKQIIQVEDELISVCMSDDLQTIYAITTDERVAMYSLASK